MGMICYFLAVLVIVIDELNFLYRVNCNSFIGKLSFCMMCGY